MPSELDSMWNRREPWHQEGRAADVAHADGLDERARAGNTGSCLSCCGDALPIDCSGGLRADAQFEAAPAEEHGYIVWATAKSMKPRSTDVDTSCTRIVWPIFSSGNAPVSRPSAGGARIRTQAPWLLSPVTMPL